MIETRSITVCDQCKKDIDGDHVFVSVGNYLSVDVQDNPVAVGSERVSKSAGRYDFCDTECFLAWLGLSDEETTG